MKLKFSDYLRKLNIKGDRSRRKRTEKDRLVYAKTLKNWKSFLSRKCKETAKRGHYGLELHYKNVDTHVFDTLDLYIDDWLEDEDILYRGKLFTNGTMVLYFYWRKR